MLIPTTVQNRTISAVGVPVLVTVTTGRGILSYQADELSSQLYTTQAPLTTSWRGRGVIASTTLHDISGSTRDGSSDENAQYGSDALEG
jgi:hypothetical protein